MNPLPRLSHLHVVVVVQEKFPTAREPRESN